MPFRQCSVTLADTGDLKPAYSTRALSVATVGWIPYFRDLKTMPSNAYVIHPYATPSPKRPFTPAPFSVLFASGNLTEGGKPENPNPDSFLGQKGLLKMLAAKNFRGALGLDNVTISRNRDKRPLKATFDFNATVGYTPVRVQAGQQTFLQYFSRGRGSGDFTVNTDNLAVVIECWVRFKIGALMDLGCYALSGRRAPSAILKMKYRISPGYADVEFHGSKIPSHAYYMNWKRLPKTHNMLDISKAEIDGFIDSKECRDTFCAVHENFGEDATTSAYTEEVF